MELVIQLTLVLSNSIVSLVPAGRLRRGTICRLQLYSAAALRPLRAPLLPVPPRPLRVVVWILIHIQFPPCTQQIVACSSQDGFDRILARGNPVTNHPSSR